MSFELEGKNVIITGAGRGIGLVIAQRFSELDARVSCWDREVIAADIQSVFAHHVVVDITDPIAVDSAFLSTVSALKTIDIIVANAGINGPTKPAWDYTLDEWNQVLDVDLTGAFLSTQPVVRHMRERGSGRIIFISSVAGKEGNPSACAYGAAKAGVIGYAKGLAQELLPSDITVNCVAPAITETDLFQEMDAAYIASKKARIPMQRFCTAAEIADMTAFIASPRCSFTTVQVFDVTGGRTTY